MNFVSNELCEARRRFMMAWVCDRLGLRAGVLWIDRLRFRGVRRVPPGRLNLLRLCLLLMASLMGSQSIGVADGIDDEEYSEGERSHWSFLPVEPVAVPQGDTPVERAGRQQARNGLDLFVLEQLARQGLAPAPEADRRTLLRRVTFDLIGLPPTPQEAVQFLSDDRPGAYERLVERLLASPHYGERWGQHWLDTVRFAESEGFEYDRHLPHAWRYRDWVISAFNQDRPYDQFVIDQLAGDERSAELDEPKSTAALVAAGFHLLGPVRRNAGNAEVAFSRNEVLTERTDIVGTVFLGVTVGCARCHDHMFDPIRQTDYYRLQAFLAATHVTEVPLGPPEVHQQWSQTKERIEQQIADVKQQLADAAEEDAAPDQEQQLRQRLAALEQEIPPPPPTVSTVTNDPQRRTAIHLLERGDENRKLQRLGMRPPGVLLRAGAAEWKDDLNTPRLRLARWIVSPNNPLTARVMVNRIWQFHFGRGLVETANDFGLNGELPSHPELLDWLAMRFVESGWSIKQMHRLIVGSHTYRQASHGDGDDLSRSVSVDPENRWLSRFSRRRLEAEEIRDSMLAVSGELNRQHAGPSIMVPVDPELVALLYKPDQWVVTADPRQHDRRSVYLLAKRNLRLPLLEVFDQPALQTSCARREQSTHAPQALELLNGQFSNRMADSLAQRIRDEAGADADRQIEVAYSLIAGRPPEPGERRLARQFLGQWSLREFSLAMLNLNAFLYVD